MNGDRRIVSDCSPGATLLEYLVILVVLGFTVYYISLQFKPKSETFFNDVTPGLGVEYPTGFTEK